MTDRETGALTSPCPTCGKARNATTQDDGSIAYDTCTKCYPKTEKAASHSPLVDVPTQDPQVRITGTEIPQEES